MFIPNPSGSFIHAVLRRRGKEHERFFKIIRTFRGRIDFTQYFVLSEVDEDDWEPSHPDLYDITQFEVYYEVGTFLKNLDDEEDMGTFEIGNFEDDDSDDDDDEGEGSYCPDDREVEVLY